MLKSNLLDGAYSLNSPQSEAVKGGELRVAAREGDIFDVDLSSLDGVVVRQDTKFMESILQSVGVPYEAKQTYRISALDLPSGSRVAEQPNDPQKWRPTNDEIINKQPIIVAHEESSVLTRGCLTCLGSLHLRPFTMHIHDVSFDGRKSNERMRLRRPCRLGIKRSMLCTASLAGLIVSGNPSLLPPLYKFPAPVRPPYVGELRAWQGGAVAAAVFVLQFHSRGCDEACDGSGSCSPETAANRTTTPAYSEDQGPCSTWLKMQYLGAFIWVSFGLTALFVGLPLGCFCAYRLREKLRLTLSVTASNHDGNMLGHVVEYVDPFCWSMRESVCKCTQYDAVYERHKDGTQRHLWTTRFGWCCCGRRGVNNCCGGTCCKHDFIIDVLDPDSHEVVATIQKTYAPGNVCDALCRMCQQFHT